MSKLKTALVLACGALLLQSSAVLASVRVTAEDLKADGIWREARIAMNRKNYELALSKWDELRAGQTLWTSHNFLYRAKCLMALGRYQEAVNDLDKMEVWDRKSGEVRQLRAKCQKLVFQDPLRLIRPE